MAVLLGVSLSFLGCEDKAEEATEPSAAEKAATALADELGADVSGTTVTLKKDTPIAKAVTVAAGVTLKTGANTLTVAGTADIISVAGEIVVENGGALKLTSGATGTFTGTVTAKSGASVYDLKSGGGSLWTAGNTGKFVYEAGSKGYIGGDQAANVRIGPADDANAKYKLASGAKFTLEAAKYTLEGSASGDPWGVSKGMTFEILEGGVYTVSGADSSFVLIGDTGADGGKLIGAGKVVVGKTELSGGTGGWQAVGNASVTIHRDGDSAASIWGSQTLRGGAGATITQLTGSGSTLNIGANDTNSAANALKLNLGTGASLILKSGANPGTVVIPKTTSYITLGSGTGGSNIGGVTTITIGGKAVTSATFVVADYQVSGGKLVKIGGTTPNGSISASTTANSDVTINADAAVTGQ
jgi:hypothetical protein